jgi:hypothetical protein
MLTDLDFEQWVQHVFSHPVGDSPWYFDTDAELWDGEPLLTVQHLTRLFESPERLLKEYSAEQLERGVWYLACGGQEFTHALLDISVPWAVRQRGLQSIQTFYREFFAIGCSDELGHLCKTRSTPINGACYMWWDMFPSWGHPEDATRQDEDQTILQVIENILDVASEACRESALHGLGHWQPHYPGAVRSIVDEFLSRKPQISAELREYALAARSGVVL